MGLPERRDLTDADLDRLAADHLLVSGPDQLATRLADALAARRRPDVLTPGGGANLWRAMCAPCAARFMVADLGFTGHDALAPTRFSTLALAALDAAGAQRSSQSLASLASGVDTVTARQVREGAPALWPKLGVMTKHATSSVQLLGALAESWSDNGLGTSTLEKHSTEYGGDDFGLSAKSALAWIRCRAHRSLLEIDSKITVVCYSSSPADIVATLSVSSRAHANLIALTADADTDPAWDSVRRVVPAEAATRGGGPGLRTRSEEALGLDRGELWNLPAGLLVLRHDDRISISALP
jgi:hypothetical protein